MRDEFYITLPSNASMRVYPKNTMSHYITKLPQRLHLEGEWEVALVEIQIPQSWDNVDSSNDAFSITSWSKTEEGTVIPETTETRKIHHGYYDTVDRLLKGMTQAMSEEERTNIVFNYNDNSRRASCTILKENISIGFSPALADMLGFFPVLSTTFVSNGEAVNVRGEYPADISRGLYNVYVNTDVVVPQLVGDTYASLLQIIPVEVGQRGGLIFNRFHDPDYIPVKLNSFDTIEIHLTTDFGETIVFNLGKTYCKLHFRKSQ